VQHTSPSSGDKNLSFHRTPSEKNNNNLRPKWLVNMKRAGNLPKDSGFFLCSKHFEPESFQRDLKVRVYENYNQTYLH
jgi:hypothetical protein